MPPKPKRQPKDFKVSRKHGEPIEFTIGGEDFPYAFTPPKQSIMILSLLDDSEMGGLTGTFEWLKLGLPEEQYARILERLRDPADDFDVDSEGGLTEIVNWLTEEASGRPTG